MSLQTSLGTWRVLEYDALSDEVDRLIAEAEAQPAEEPTESLDLPEDQSQRGPHVHYTVEPGKRDTQAERVVTVYGGDGVRVVLGDEPEREPQEGDDVRRMCRDCDHWLDMKAMLNGIPYGECRAQLPAVGETKWPKTNATDICSLFRRALR